MPQADSRDAHASVRQPAHRDLVEPSSRVQTGAESVAAPLIRSDAPKIKVLTHFQSVNAIRNLAVRARLLDSRTEVRVSQRDAALVAA